MQQVLELVVLQENIVFKEIDEGLLVQIMDQDGKVMFVFGKVKMNKVICMLMEILGVGLVKLLNDMVIFGYMDVVFFVNQMFYDNWDLFFDCVNVMCCVLL